MTKSPGPKAWTSKPWPTFIRLLSCGFGFAGREQVFGERQVSRGGDFDVGGRAFHEQWLVALPFEGLGFVGGEAFAGEGAFERGQQQAKAEHLRRACAPETGPV